MQLHFTKNLRGPQNKTSLKMNKVGAELFQPMEPNLLGRDKKNTNV